MKRIICTILIIIGILGIANTILTLTYASVNFGNVFPACAGTILILLAIFSEKILIFLSTESGRMVGRITAFGIIIAGITFMIFLATSISAAKTKPFDNADAIIVLGAGLNGEEVSLTLGQRLIKAKEYWDKNNDAVIVVSGGQGRNEKVTEASAMENYLSSLGVDKDKIIMEERSTDTKENFKYSKEILDSYFGHEDYKAVFVTSDFHIFRAGMIADDIGLDAEGLASPSPFALKLNLYIREYFALLKYYGIKLLSIFLF